ncbi:MAG: AmmeMemoRadiSam system protein B [Patescibacteria group bacterium]
MIVFAALTPHSPLLLPSVNKDKQKPIAKTKTAMAALADELYAAKPDVILIISSHGNLYEDAFTINLHDAYRPDLSEFGDLTLHRPFSPDFKLIDDIQRALRRKQFPIGLTSDEKLDYGASVPLLLLTEHLPSIHIVPLSYSHLGGKEHFQFGDALKDVLVNSNKRIAVIASGDQSHALQTTSPAGFHKQGKAYDKAIQDAIVNRNTAQLLKLTPESLEHAHQCSYQPILMLLGIMERLSYDPVIHSYEFPFGVGYLVVHFELG